MQSLTRGGFSHRNEYGVSCSPDSRFLTGYDSDDASVRAAFSKEMFIDPKQTRYVLIRIDEMFTDPYRRDGSGRAECHHDKYSISQFVMDSWLDRRIVLTVHDNAGCTIGSFRLRGLTQRGTHRSVVEFDIRTHL